MLEIKAPLNKRLLLTLLVVSALSPDTLSGQLYATSNMQLHNRPATPPANVFRQVVMHSIFSGHCSAIILCRMERISF